jgi:hypothetical protein
MREEDLVKEEAEKIYHTAIHQAMSGAIKRQKRQGNFRRCVAC